MSNQPTTDELVAWLREQATDYNHHPFAQMTLAAAANALSATPTREELLAMVDDLRATLQTIHRIECSIPVQDIYSLAMLHGSPYAGETWQVPMRRALALTPTAALADLKARVRREVLEEVAKVADSAESKARNDSSRQREYNNLDGAMRHAAKASMCADFAAELRRMAEGDTK